MATATAPTPAEVFGAAGGGIRVKNPSEMYSTKRAVGLHVKTGRVVQDEKGRIAETPSEMNYAKLGVFFKHCAAQAGLAVSIKEHDTALLNEMCANDVWCGNHEGEYKTDLVASPKVNIKALISDATSGGSELNPFWLDEELVTFPLLHSEFFPFVDLKEIPRGDTVHAASVGNPTVQWGVGEASSMSLFNTDALCAQIASTVHNVSCVVEIGKDLLQDSPADVGKAVYDNVGQAMLNDFDRVIVKGDGLKEPQGITVASGLGSVAFTNTTTGPPAVADYEGLLFGVSKAYRANKSLNFCFGANDTTYARARGIQVTSSDQRRVFGMDHESYELLNRPYRINNSLANGVIFSGCLKKYRLWRRRGMEVIWEKCGESLVRRNLVLLVVRSRLAGKMVDVSAFAKGSGQT